MGISEDSPSVSFFIASGTLVAASGALYSSTVRTMPVIDRLSADMASVQFIPEESDDVLDDDKALVVAVYKGDAATVDWLLAHNADVNSSISGFTILVLAIVRTDLVLIESLLQAGADVNKTTSLGMSPLMVAATGAYSLGDPLPVAMLLEAGADVNYCDPASGETALSTAVKASSAHDDANLPIIRSLVRAGASVLQNSNTGGPRRPENAFGLLSKGYTLSPQPDLSRMMAILRPLYEEEMARATCEADAAMRELLLEEETSQTDRSGGAAASSGKKKKHKKKSKKKRKEEAGTVDESEGLSQSPPRSPQGTPDTEDCCVAEGQCIQLQPDAAEREQAALLEESDGGHEKSLCSICLDSEMDTVLISCGHRTCWSCWETLKRRRSRPCPFCRTEIVDAIRYY